VARGLLDAYTESGASAATGMSDSDRFKEGYTKKNKNKRKTEQQRKSESEQLPTPEPIKEEKPVKDEEVIESWEDIEAEAMPVPIKVKKELRMQEKKNKAKLQQQKTASEPKKTEVTPEKNTEPNEEKSDELVESFESLNLNSEINDTEGPTGKDMRNTSPKTDNKTPKTDNKTPKTDNKTEETNKVQAEREAKKAAKAAAKAAATNKKKVEKLKPESVEEKEDDKSKEKEEKKPDNITDKEVENINNLAEQNKVSEDEGEKNVGGKSKSELKAERRAKQEAQRAAKALAQGQKVKAGEVQSGDKNKESKEGKANKSSSKQTYRVPDDIQADRASVEKKIAKRLASQKVPARTKAQRQIPLFSHLHQYERELSATRSLPVSGGNLHPAVLQLGLQYAEGVVTGSEGRCVALLQTLKTVISEYLSNPDKSDSSDPPSQTKPDLWKELEVVVKPNITFLKQCRPQAIAMSNAIRYLKKQVSNLSRGLSYEEARKILEERIEGYIHENIELAAQQIAITAATKINDGDVILTYSNSSLIEKVLVDAAASGRKFKVIVADGRVRSEGRRLAVRLSAAGIQTTYILLTAAPAVIASITKVLLGCHGVMANGCVMAHIGTSQVALMAKSAGKPVLVCCETYKFTERVQTDSFVYNELADPDELVHTGSVQQHLGDWRDQGSLCLLNLMYDVTPASFVDAVITEISIIPTTSVPVVLRLKHTEGHLAV